MVLSSLFGKETTVGIDIGSSCIKVVEIEPTSTGWMLANAAVTPTPTEAIREGVIIDIVEVSHSIKALLKETGIKAGGAVCAISGSQVIVRQVQFPKMAEAVLRKSIKYEASKFISSSMEDSVVEFEILGDAEEPGLMNVMLVACPCEMIDSRVKAIEAAGLEPMAIDVEAFALIRSLVEFSASDQYLQRTVALIDMGASHTDLDIISRGEFVLRRDISIAGDSFTNAIKALTGKTFEEAEQMKLEMAKMCSIDQISPECQENRTWRVVQPLLDELIREIRRSIHYYQSMLPEGSTDQMIGKVILTGGSARMPGMSTYITSKLSITTDIADVFGQTAISTGNVPESFLQEYGPVLAVGTGLALKEFTSEVRPERSSQPSVVNVEPEAEACA